MTTDKQAVKVRLGESHRATLDSLAIKLSLSKNAVIEQALELFAHSHTLSGATIDKSVSTLKGLAAQRAIELGKVHWLDSGHPRFYSNEQVLWSEGWLWLIGKSANGSQKVIEKFTEYPEVLFDGAGTTSFKLTQYVDAKANWDELKQLDGIELVDRDFFDTGECFFVSWRDWRTFSNYKERAIEAIAEAREAIELAKVAELAAIAAPTAALEVVNKDNKP